MYQLSGSTQAALDYNSTIIGALELSEKKWVLAVQLPGVRRHSRHVLEACGDGLASFVERLKARCAAAGRKIARVILTHEAGRDGFWLARFLARRGIEVHVIQPSSLPVDRRARRAKTDIIDVEMLLRIDGLAIQRKSGVPFRWSLTNTLTRLQFGRNRAERVRLLIMPRP
jgi:transposase